MFASLLVSVLSDAKADPSVAAKLLNNADFLHFLVTSGPEDLQDQLSAYEDLTAAATYIAGGSEQAQGVISEMYSVIRDLFIGVFALKGDFSIRRFVRGRGGRVLFLEYDLAIGNVLTPIYRPRLTWRSRKRLGRTVVAVASTCSLTSSSCCHIWNTLTTPSISGVARA